jgi:hypothetical protein
MVSSTGKSTLQRNWPILGLYLCHDTGAMSSCGSFAMRQKKYISADAFDKDSLIKVCLLFVLNSLIQRLALVKCI